MNKIICQTSSSTRDSKCPKNSKTNLASGSVPLPPGYEGQVCPVCGNRNLLAKLMTETADERDPDIFCCNCKSFW